MFLVTTPVWKTYYERMNKNQLNIMREFSREMKDEYSVNYYDFLQDSRFVANDYSDADHMSCDGAKKLSAIIANDLSNK